MYLPIFTPKSRLYRNKRRRDLLPIHFFLALRASTVRLAASSAGVSMRNMVRDLNNVSVPKISIFQNNGFCARVVVHNYAYLVRRSNTVV